MVDKCGHIYRVTGQPQRASSLPPPLDSTGETLVTMSAHKAASTHWAIQLPHILFPGKVLLWPWPTQNSPCSSCYLKLSAILQSLPLECWGISHTSTPLPDSDTYFWNLFLGTGGMWLLVDPQSLHEDRIQPHLPTSFSKDYTPT